MMYYSVLLQHDSKGYVRELITIQVLGTFDMWDYFRRCLVVGEGHLSQTGSGVLI